MKEVGSGFFSGGVQKKKYICTSLISTLFFLSVINSINKIPSHKRIKKNNGKLMYRVETSLMCCYFEGKMDLRGKSNV